MKKPFTFLASSGGGTPSEADLPWSGLWLGSTLTAHSIPSSPSAGSSGSSSQEDFTDSGGLNCPGAGSTLNGFGSAAWSRSGTTSLETIKTLNYFIPTDPHLWSFFWFGNIVDIIAGGTAPYLLECMISDLAGWWAMGPAADLSGNNLHAGTFPADAISAPANALTVGSPVCVQARGVGGGQVDVRINRGSFNSTSGSGISNRSAVLIAGKSGSTSAYLHADMYSMGVQDGSISDPDSDTLLDKINSKYGTSF